MVSIGIFPNGVDRKKSKCYSGCINNVSTLKTQKGKHMIAIDYKDTRPIYEQVVEKFKLLILKGVISTDEKIPSVRSLAVDLSINPNTIQRAYAELERQGYIYTVKGKGNFVSETGKLLVIYREEIFIRLKCVCKEAFDAGISEDEITRKIHIWRGL